MISFNSSINYKSTINKSSDKVSFGSTNRFYQLKVGSSNIKMCNLTLLFRPDIEWLKFARYVQELFKGKDKVNIVQFASSSGAEAYTQIISLLETGSEKEVQKFFPIKSYDIDSTIVNVAKSGLINLNENELNIFSANNISLGKYFNLSEQKLSLENEHHFFAQKTYKVKDILSQNVIFEKGDMFNLAKDIKDESNSIVFCRNCLAYFNEGMRENFIQNMAKNLKERSLLVIGDFDFDFGLSSLLNKYRFREIFQNVYQKIDNNFEPIAGFKKEQEMPIWEKLKQFI